MGCKESVEALVQENQEEETQQQQNNEEEEQQQPEESNDNEEENQAEPLSLEQMEANGQHLNDANEEIVEEEEDEQEEVVKKSPDQEFWNSGQVFTPEDVEEVEREELPEVNHEAEVG